MVDAVTDGTDKYLNASSSSLTDCILQSIRLQRHNGLRILLSTQEPTVIPSQILDLCNNIIIHRFSSPAWLVHLSKHISTSASASEIFDKVSTLDNGEALVVSPTAIVLKGARTTILGRECLHVKIRQRVSADGGQSIMANDSAKT